VFPVDGKVSYGRAHALYPATDILARCGAVARSPVDGVVLELSRVDKFVKAAPKGADRGGLFVSIRGADGVRYYSAHLSQVGAALRPGTDVKAGDPIGLVGRTGNANNICHVHFALSPPCLGAGDWWNRRGVIFPWPYLDSWRAGGARSPAAAVTAWQRKPGCGTQPPPA
jgi:murein DD-endopeptidase MepM/ murein hydrolase activator NlpD